MRETACGALLLSAALLASCSPAKAAATSPAPALRQIAPRLFMSAARILPRRRQLYQRHPAVAYGNGTYLVVWQEGYNGLGGNSDILGLRLDDNGAPLDRRPIPICTNASVQDAPAVAYCRGQFLVVWSDLRNGRDYDIYGTLVNLRGRVSIPNGFLLSGRRGGQASPAVTSNNRDTFFVVWQDFRSGQYFQICGARVSAESGAIRDTAGLEIMPRGEIPAVTYTGTHYLVCQRWYGALVDQNMQVTPLAGGQRLWNGKTVLFPAVASAWGTGFSFFNTSPRHDPWGWGGNGAIIGVSIARDGRSPEAGWVKSRRALSRMKADGRIVNCLDAARWRNHPGWPMGMPGGFKNTHEGTWPSGRVAAAYNGRSIVVVWNRAHVIDKSRLGNRDLYLRRVLKGWAYTDRTKIKIVAGPTEEVFPVLAAGRTGDVLLAYERQAPGGGIGIEHRLIREGEDRQPPRVAYISRESDENMIVGFDEPVDPASASKAENYSVDGVTVKLAAFNKDPRALQREVIIETAPQTRGKTYVLRIKGVRDRSENKNATAGRPVKYLCKPGKSQRSDFIARWAVVGRFPNNWDVSYLDGKTVHPSPGDTVASKSAAELRAHLKKVIPAGRWAKENWDAKVTQYFVGEHKWRAIECAGGCILPISKSYGEIANASIYANTYVFSDEVRRVIVRIDSDDGHRAWLNGKEISFDPTKDQFRGFHAYTNEIPATLSKGWNQLLIQVENRFGRWQMAVQITDGDKQPIRGLTYQLENPLR